MTTKPIMLPKRRILVVDDDRPICESLQMALENEGYEIETATSGKEALAILGDHEAKFDLCILDLVMPEMTGYQVSREIKRREYLVPILAMSGASGFMLAQVPLDYADGFLPKPFDLEELFKVVEVMSRRRLDLITERAKYSWPKKVS